MCLFQFFGQDTKNLQRSPLGPLSSNKTSWRRNLCAHLCVPKLASTPWVKGNTTSLLAPHSLPHAGPPPADIVTVPLGISTLLEGQTFPVSSSSLFSWTSFLCLTLNVMASQGSLTDLSSSHSLPGQLQSPHHSGDLHAVSKLLLVCPAVTWTFPLGSSGPSHSNLCELV